MLDGDLRVRHLSGVRGTAELPGQLGTLGQAGRTEGMLAVSLIMIAAAVVVFIIARTLGMKRIFA